MLRIRKGMKKEGQEWGEANQGSGLATGGKPESLLLSSNRGLLRFLKKN